MLAKRIAPKEIYNSFESEIAEVLQKRGFDIYKNVNAHPQGLIEYFKATGKSVAISQLKLQDKTLNDKDRRVDFMLVHNGKSYILESKRMSCWGSVVEKFVYTVTDLNMSNRDYVIVYDFADKWLSTKYWKYLLALMGSNSKGMVSINDFEGWLDSLDDTC